MGTSIHFMPCPYFTDVSGLSLIASSLLLFANNLELQYMLLFFFAYIFVELFLNNECTYLNDF